MKRSIIVLFFFFIVVAWTSAMRAEAQNNPGIEQVEVALWPEYDQHAILVIYRVQLAADTPLPAQVRLPMPAKAGDPYAVAWLGEGGQLLVADYESEAQGEWNIVTLTSSSLVAQLEYYIDYELSDSNRKVVFTWPEGFAVENLSYEVQQPEAVEELQVIPPPERSITGKDGLQYHQADLGEVLASQSVRIELSYSNPSNQLTVDSFALPEPLPLRIPVVAEGGTPDLLQILPWLLGGLGLSLVVVGGVLYFQSRRRPQRAKKKPQVRARMQVYDDEEKAGVDSSAVYCHQCGTKASVSDRFCRHCGVPLRR